MASCHTDKNRDKTFGNMPPCLFVTFTDAIIPFLFSFTRTGIISRSDLLELNGLSLKVREKQVSRSLSPGSLFIRVRVVRIYGGH